jgi:carbon monoxide dehydrogenase subunit G
MELTFRVKKGVETVFEHLSDMSKFVKVHPIIHRIDPLGGNRYRIHEKLKFGPVPFAFTYVASVEGRRSDMTVVIRATVFKVTRIEMTFKLNGNDHETEVKENVVFSTPLLIKSLMRRVFKEQHQILFENIGRSGN